MTKKTIILLLGLFLCIACVFCVIQNIMPRIHSQRMVDAIKQNDYESLQKLVQKHPNAINTTPISLPYFLRRLMDSAPKYPPLHVACKYGRSDMVELLVIHGADVNLQDDLLHDTPLNMCLRGNTPNKYEIANVLLENKADVTLRRRYNDDYDTIGAFLRGCSGEFNVEEEAFFLHMLTAIDSDSYDYGDLLETIILLNRFKALTLLCEFNDFDINRYRCYEVPPLIYACLVATSNYEMVALLLEYGADRALQDNNGKTAFDYAIEMDNADIATILKP